MKFTTVIWILLGMLCVAQISFAQVTAFPDNMREIAVQQGHEARKMGVSADLGPFINEPLLNQPIEISGSSMSGMKGSIRAIVGGRNFSAADVDNAMIPFTTFNGYGLSNLFHDGGEWPGTNGNPTADDGVSSFGSEWAGEIYDLDGNGHYPKAVLRYIGTHCYIFVPVMFFPTLPRPLSPSEDFTPPALPEWGMYWPDSVYMQNGPYYFAPNANGTVLEPRYVLGADKNYARLRLKEMADQFDGIIYPKMREHFGNEPDIDGDPKVFILLDDIRDGSGSYRGYFWAGNQFPITSQALSNEKELLNIDIFPSFSSFQADTYGTVAHEFVHMIIYNEGYYLENNVLKGMERWLEEGLTQYGQYLYDGKVTSNLDEFIKKPDVILADDRVNEVWLGSSPFANYGASFLWMFYLVEKYGASNLPGFLRTMIRYRDGGMGSVDAVLKPFNTDAKSVFADWAIANYLDKTRKRDGSLLNDGKWGYNVDNDNDTTNDLGKYEKLPVKFSEKVLLTGPVTARSSNVNPWAADYIEISGNTGNLNIGFDGSDKGQFKAAIIKRGPDVDTSVEFLYLNDRQTGNLIIQNYGAGSTYENIVLVPMVLHNNNFNKLSYVYSASFDDLKVAIFPNPTFENELHIIVRTDKKFSSEPRLQMTYEGEQGYLVMVPVNDSTYITNYSLKRSGEGAIVANGTNADGVILSNQIKFSAVYYPPNSQGLLTASFVTLDVPAGSLRNGGTVVVAATENVVSYRELTRLSRNVDVTLPVAKAEAAIGIEVPLISDYACDSSRVGIYRATSSGARWIGSASVADKHAKGHIDVSGSIFIAADEVAPVISANAESERGGWLRLKVSDNGSGINEQTIKASCNKISLPVKVSNGEVWVHAVSVADGDREIFVEAADNAGNVARATVRGLVVGATSLVQISTYPNPARNFANIRVSFSGPAATTAEARVKIYDTAGHKVSEMPLTNLGSGDYEARWDLTNSKGKAVANGLYYAEVKASLSGESTKERRKIAVLR